MRLGPRDPRVPVSHILTHVFCQGKQPVHIAVRQNVDDAVVAFSAVPFACCDRWEERRNGASCLATSAGCTTIRFEVASRPGVPGQLPFVAFGLAL